MDDKEKEMTCTCVEQQFSTFSITIIGLLTALLLLLLLALGIKACITDITKTRKPTTNEEEEEEEEEVEEENGNIVRSLTEETRLEEIRTVPNYPEARSSSITDDVLKVVRRNVQNSIVNQARGEYYEPLSNRHSDPHEYKALNYQPHQTEYCGNGNEINHEARRNALYPEEEDYTDQYFIDHSPETFYGDNKESLRNFRQHRGSVRESISEPKVHSEEFRYPAVVPRTGEFQNYYDSPQSLRRGVKPPCTDAVWLSSIGHSSCPQRNSSPGSPLLRPVSNQSKNGFLGVPGSFLRFKDSLRVGQLLSTAEQRNSNVSLATSGHDYQSIAGSKDHLYDSTGDQTVCVYFIKGSSHNGHVLETDL